VKQTLAPEIQASLLGRWEPVYRSQLHYLVTWGTRGRRPVLRERHVRALERMVHEACDAAGIQLVEFAAAADHVHVLFGSDPTLTVASAVREFKGRTGVALMREFPELRVWLRAHLMWDERYAVETVSGPRLEKVRMNLRAHHGISEELAAAS
jgi:REP element-mobilizing transposase RayT